MSLDRLTIAEAARRLGISKEGVRKRVKRGSIQYDQEPDGRFYVYLDTPDNSDNQGGDAAPDASANQIISRQDAEIAFLRAELERRGEEADRYQRIVAGLSQANADLSARVRELESLEPPEPNEDSPREPPAASEGDEYPEAATGPPSGVQRPWWRRLLGR